jgi:hypothetical protein
LTLFPRGSSLGFFGTYGRSSDLRQLDDALRTFDVHPKLVPEPVKLTIAKFLKEDFGDEPPAVAFDQAAELVCYCVVGANGFAGSNGTNATQAVENRIEKSLLSGRNLDARIILLALHAKIIQPSVIEMFDLESN